MLRVVALTFVVFGLLLSALPGLAVASVQYVPEMRYFAVSDKRAERLPQAALRSDAWQPVTEARPNFGYDPRVFWFRFKPREPRLDADKPVERMVSIGYPQLDDVRFYLVRDGQVVDRLITGDRRPYSERAVHHPRFLFPMTLEPGGDYEVLVRVDSEGSMQVPIEVWAPMDLFEQLNLQDQVHALYYGILLVIICFNLFIFFALREKTYIFYALTITSYLLFMLSLRGTAFAVLWPDSPWLHNKMMLVSVPATILFSALFVRSFLRLDHHNPVLDRLARGGIFLGALAVAGAFVLDYSVSTRFSVLLAVPAFVMLLVIGPIEWARGNRAAKYYTLAWAALTIGALLAALNKLGVLPSNFITEYGIQMGSAAEAILLTVALAERLYRERVERIEAQDQRLREHAERREAELRLVDQALHHPVTGLPNRTSFELSVDEYMRDELEQRHIIMVIQLTNYQDIQKTLGHANTEQLLETIAGEMEQLAAATAGARAVEDTGRARHWLSSLETHRFALLLDADADQHESSRVYRLMQKLREPFEFLGMELPLNFKAGMAIHPDHGEDASTLIRRAFIALESEDARLQHAAFYQLNRDVYSPERLTLAAELQRALDEDTLELHFQPQFHYGDNRICGVEGLLRWPGRNLGPEEVVAVAEETGLIKPLTRRVLQKAARMRARLIEAGHESVSVSVNISANNLREPDFVAFVRRLMDENRHYDAGLVLELTETAMMVDPSSSMKVLRALNDAGIRIAIDDFGSGYSSLSYLKQLPATELKIDKSLTHDINRSQDARLIVQTTIEMSHNLGYRVVAEGVEDGDTSELLRTLECDSMQGYYLARVIAPDELMSWLQEFVPAE